MDKQQSDIQYSITANLSKFEWYIIQMMRNYTTRRGYGRIHIAFQDGLAVNCHKEDSMNPAELRKIQGKDDGRGEK